LLSTAWMCSLASSIRISCIARLRSLSVDVSVPANYQRRQSHRRMMRDWGARDPKPARRAARLSSAGKIRLVCCGCTVISQNFNGISELKSSNSRRLLTSVADMGPVPIDVAKCLSRQSAVAAKRTIEPGHQRFGRSARERRGALPTDHQRDISSSQLTATAISGRGDFDEGNPYAAPNFVLAHE